VYRNLRAVIDRLDARRPQIYVESMIVEVSDGKTQELGVQLQGLMGAQGSNQVFAGTSFQNSVPGSNIVTLGTSASSLLTLGANANGNTVLPSGGTNIGVFRNFNGVMGLAGLARAVSNISGVNVLSAPNLLTLDNEAATIVIADNIPVVTGQYAATAGTSAISPFTTVDRKDVGLTLKIKPQISEGGLVKLQIYEESSTVDSNTATNAYGPSYTKRSLETNVLVEDGQLIVLGGLLSDSYNESVQKTPFLGDLPLLGALFRYETKARTKDNLMLFLRPYVVRTAEQSDALTNDRYNRINGIRENLEPNVKYLGNEVLTPMPAAKGSGMPLVDPARADTGATAKPLPGGSR
jgi:general secretion pathway protein D